MTYPRKPCVECGRLVREVSEPSEHAPTCSERAPEPERVAALEAVAKAARVFRITVRTRGFTDCAVAGCELDRALAALDGGGR